MIMSHKHKFIFFKTRKTASTSIEIALSKYCGPDDIITNLPEPDEAIRKSLGHPGPQNWEIGKSLQMHTGHRHIQQHSPAYSIMKWIDVEVWKSYFKFCFIRNPFDAAISRYWWDKSRSSINSLRHILPMTHNDPFPCDINVFIKNISSTILSNWEIYGQDDGTVLMDFVGRYETLQDNLSQVSETLGLGNIDLPDAKRQHRKDYRHYSCVLNAESRAKIEQSCKRELEPMDYRWEFQQ